MSGDSPQPWPEGTGRGRNRLQTGGRRAFPHMSRGLYPGHGRLGHVGVERGRRARWPLRRRGTYTRRMPLCVNCGEENPERARFCLNCGSSLALLCPSCGEENPEKAKFCLNCGSPLAQAAAPPPPPPPPKPPDEERKLDTLVFVDLVGSTALAESLDPEDVLALRELYYTRLRAELERHGGTVEKYIGDAIVTHFGVPVAHEDDPERAVRAALDILRTVEALNAEDTIREIQVRIGVATGEVIVTHGQKAEEGKGIAWGDILNTAARIESAAPVNGILVGEQTYRASSSRIEYREHEH